MKPLNFIILILFIAFVGGAYYSGQKSVVIPPCPEPEIEVKWLTITKYDTIKTPPILVPVHDTIIVHGIDTIKTQFAQIDTMLETSDSLSIKYFYEPSAFEIEFYPALDSVAYITETYHDTITIQTPRKWFDKFNIGYGVGTIATIAIGFIFN